MASPPSPPDPPSAPSICTKVEHFLSEEQMKMFAENICSSLETTITDCEGKDGTVEKLLRDLFPTKCLCDDALQTEMIETVSNNMEKYLKCAENYEVNCFPANMFKLTGRHIPFIGAFDEELYDTKRKALEDCVNVPFSESDAAAKIYLGVNAAVKFLNTCGDKTLEPPGTLEALITQLVTDVNTDDDTTDDDLTDATNQFFNYLAIPVTNGTEVTALNAMKGLCALAFQTDDINSFESQISTTAEQMLSPVNTFAGAWGDLFEGLFKATDSS
jgi:hypothetical protein